MELDRGVGAKGGVGGKWEGAIDQRFARGIGPDRDDATIVQTVVSLGYGLGIRMIARGVETLEQLLSYTNTSEMKSRAIISAARFQPLSSIVAPGK